MKVALRAPRPDRAHRLVDPKPTGEHAHALAGVGVAEHDFQASLLADRFVEVGVGERALQDVDRLGQDVRHLEERHHRHRRRAEHLTDQAVGLPQVLGALSHADHAPPHIPVNAAPARHIVEEAQHVRDRAVTLEEPGLLAQLDRDDKSRKLLEQQSQVPESRVRVAETIRVLVGQPRHRAL